MVLTGESITIYALKNINCIKESSEAIVIYILLVSVSKSSLSVAALKAKYRILNYTR